MSYQGHYFPEQRIWQTRKCGDQHRRARDVRHAPLHVSQPQAELVQPEQRFVRTFRPTERGRPLLHHIRPAGELVFVLF